MFAFRDFLTFSTSGLVVLSGGGVAIAQTTPPQIATPEPPVGQAPQAPLPPLATPGVDPLDTAAFLPSLGGLSQPTTLAALPLPAADLDLTPTAHLGTIQAPAPLLAQGDATETPSTTGVDVTLPTAETNPTIPLVQPLPPDRVINEDLNQLLEPIENPAVTVPQEATAVTTDNVVDLTLEETIRLALERNETLQEARLNYDRSEEFVQEAIAAEYPNLSNQFDITRTDSANGELQARNLGRDNNATTAINGRLEVSYDIYTGGRRSAQIEAAQTQLQIAELDIERLTEETRLAAAVNYYNLQSADAQVVIEQSSVFDATQSLRDATLLEQAGLGTKFDVLRAEVELASAQQRLTRAEATQRTARRQLAQLLSLAPTIDPRTADEINLAGRWEISLEETIVLALQNRQELRQQLLQREIDGYQERIALAAVRPLVSVFANYDVLEVFDDSLGPADGLTVGARMRWNFFDGGAAAARANQEQVDQAIAENRFANQRNQIRLAVETAYYDFEASEQNITTAAAAVTLAEESLRLARLRFNAGVGTQTDVISAQTGLNTARGNYLQAVTDYNRAFAQLKREVGLGDAVIAPAAP
ncbi:TolC family protein [Picosynechococcus sp. PCC 7117]|uniref:TolC family protein n=1 Tax=Picosynechococcus sp. PCC 7117 TaxID=195498 RepID=UPI0008109830|nr:TolC family protein [Picosynechococcus sp. PCC 7117]ANV86523.1 transporter [Picosynechococcus sp. PCC 7117]